MHCGASEEERLLGRLSLSILQSTHQDTKKKRCLFVLCVCVCEREWADML